MEEETEAGRDRRTRSRNTVIDRLAMNNPQSVNCHRMTGLETVSELASKKSGAARRPRKQGLGKRDRMGKAEVGTEIRPNLLCQGTRKEKMTEGLFGGTSVTKEVFRSKPKYTCAQGKSIHEELVPGFPVPRKGGRTPKSSPDVRRRDRQTRDGTSRPIQGRGDPSQAVKITSSLGNG